MATAQKYKILCVYNNQQAHSTIIPTAFNLEYVSSDGAFYIRSGETYVGVSNVHATLEYDGQSPIGSESIELQDWYEFNNQPTLFVVEPHPRDGFMIRTANPPYLYFAWYRMNHVTRILARPRLPFVRKPYDDNFYRFRIEAI